MAHGLEEWLAHAWIQCQGTRMPTPFTEIYKFYETAVDPNERCFTLGAGGPVDFPDIQAPENVVEKYFEGDKGAVMFMTEHREEEEDDDPLLIGGTNTKMGYLYFFSPSHVDGGSRYRVVINAYPYNKLIAMMRLVVREMVKPGGCFRKVNGAKVMTKACYQSGRNDTLIIYSQDRKTADRVLLQIGMWIADGQFSTKDFGALLPKTIKQKYTGVGYASEPPQTQFLRSYSQPLSYGKFLSQVIYIATTIALTARLKNVKQFAFLATEVLKHAGVNAPDEPYEFGVMSPSFSDCMPWDDQSAWGTALQDQIKRTKLYKKVTERTEIAFSYYS